MAIGACGGTTGSRLGEFGVDQRRAGRKFVRTARHYRTVQIHASGNAH